RAVRAVEGERAEVIVGLLPMKWDRAEALAREVAGLDFGIVGAGAPALPEEVRQAPEKVGDAWLVQPADRGQVVSRLDLGVRGDGGFEDALGEGRAAAELAALEQQLERTRADVARWERDPSADAAFLATQKQELARLEARRDALAKTPLRKPERGNWFTLTQVPIKKQLACDPEI